MKNKHYIKLVSSITLAVTLLFITWNLNEGVNRTAQAAISANEDSVGETNLPSDGANGGTIISSIRSDMDVEGNQYYTWTIDRSNGCYGVVYQVYNKAGIPITQPVNVDYACRNSALFYNPDIVVTNDYFAVVYNKFTPYNSSYSVHLRSVNLDYSEHSAPVIVDSGLLLDINAHPKIATSLAGDQVGVTFAACENVACLNHDIYFQGYEAGMTPMHASNQRINNTADGNQTNPSIDFSGLHFLISFTETSLTGNTYVQARAVNYTANSISDEINIETGAAPITTDESVVAGILDSDYTATPINESFYVSYVYHATNGNTEIRMKKIYCQYDSANPGNFSCNKTFRESEPVYVRVNSSGTMVSKPVITAFKNTDNIKRASPNENTNIDVVTVAWISTYNGVFHVKAQNYSDTLSKTGSEISVADGVSHSDGISIASSRDGYYGISFKYLDPLLGNHAKLYSSRYLKLGVERLVNAPDSNVQENVKISKNSNGNYAIAYQNFNGTDYDVVYAIYDQFGNAIKNTSIANNTTRGNQQAPQISFWNEQAGSPNYGKFIIVWEGEGPSDNNGIYYQIFNADGTTSGSEMLVNSNIESIQNSPDLSTGKFGQFAIIYAEILAGQTRVTIFYNDGSNQTYLQNAPVTETITNLNIGLSPEADGTTGSSGQSKFAISWYNGTIGKVAEGYLNTSSTLTLSSGPTDEQFITNDMDGAYNSANSTMTPALNTFYYVRTGYWYNGPGSNTALKINYFGSSTSIENQLDIEFTGSSVAIDPATQNIFIVGKKFANYVTNSSKVLLFPANAPTDLTNEHIYDQNLETEADVLEGHGTYVYLENATQPFTPGLGVGHTAEYTVVSTSDNNILNFDHDVTGHFTIGQAITDTTNSITGTVMAVGNNYINVEPNGFSASGGTLDNSPYNDSYTGVFNDSLGVFNNLHFNNGEAGNFENLNTISNIDHTTFGQIQDVTNDILYVEQFNGGTFSPFETLLDYNSRGTYINDNIEYVSGNFYKFTINSSTNSPVWTKAGPTFSVNHMSYYGQSFSDVDAAYNTASSGREGKFVATAYSTISSADYLDANGIYQQLIDDPFSIGSKEDLSPTTEQQINPGGRYIIVPGTIDFGTLQKNTTGSADFATLTPDCLSITDLDGTNFDLTVSLTNLINANNNTLQITNDNFIIENNNGVNPPIVNQLPFSSVNDVTLDPSTNPGENANLGSTRTLLHKNSFGTGSWKICPKAMLNIPATANSGIYNGTLTFTLI